jgi:hypothetical protein
MRAIMLVVCIATLTTPVLRAQTAQVPPVIRAGMEAYKVGGAAAAAVRWLKDSPITEASGSAIQGFAQIELAYGRMIGYDVLQVVHFGTYAERTYVVILYEKGPVYAWFDCYMAKDDWITTAFLFNTKADQILPPKMMTN